VGCSYSEVWRPCIDYNENASESAIESNSFTETVVEVSEDPQTSTAVFCCAIPYNPTACEPWIHWFRRDFLLWHLSNAFSQQAHLEASSILYLLDPFFSPEESVAPISDKCSRSTKLLQDCCCPKPYPQSNDSSPELALRNAHRN